MKPRPPEEAMPDDGAWLPPEEAERRRDDALHRLLNTPPKPRKTATAAREKGDPRRGRPGSEGGRGKRF